MPLKVLKYSIILILCSCSDVIHSADSVVEESSRYAGIYSPYRYGNMKDTGAPSGYKPFYISHYSRHGSRYLIKEEDFDIVDEFEKYLSEDRLSKKGKSLLNDMKRLHEEHERMFSFLTLKGGKEQQEIARRMAKRFPEVFKNDGKVRCISSPAQRCNQSLANFTLSLASEHNKLDFSIQSGHRYYDIISARIEDREIRNHYADIRDSMIVAGRDAEQALKECFIDPESLNADWTWMTHAVYNLCCGMQTQDYSAPSMDTYFSPEQLEILWRAENAYDYGVFCDTLTFGTYRTDHVAKPILREFIDQAEHALTENERVADFRFGHDSGLTPFLILIGLEGYDKQHTPSEAWKFWHNYDKVCMGSNVQFVFYRHRNKEILVKVLRNEQETTIPCLSPVHGPYYSWQVLKDYLLTKL